MRHEPRPATLRVEAAALLLDANGTARTGADVVFQARPVHPSAAVRHTSDPRDDGTQWLELDLPHIEAEIERVLVVCSTDSGTAGDLTQPTVEAFAPNGVSVVRYTVTDAPTETAFVFGEFYRRAGGWKFRTVGQGYASGLAGLTCDYGIEVTAAPPSPTPVATLPPAPATLPPAPAPAPLPPASPSSGSVLLTGLSKTSDPPPFPTSSPVSAAGPGPAPLAPDRPYPAGGWAFGPVFEPCTIEGRGRQVVTAGHRVPLGPVLVEMTHEGDDYLCVERLNKANKDDQLVFNSTLKDIRGRAAVEPAEDRPLRLRIQASNRWTLTFRPLADARRLESGRELSGRGPEALLYTGPVADLKVRLRDETGGSLCCMYGYEVAGHTTIAAAPESLLVNEAGRGARASTPLPEGPLLLRFIDAEGSWRMKLRAV
ncbi:TerD family protein [Streptomyces sp. NRRL F-2580]|uniref:TerD family protein n=1 Tax=Streptomyces sp. NRRL F-2580 TaxID=1463841 RepID=UPI00069211D4|nr:TerD family protein [Streptomyces sp. NRRL F-2580]